MNLFHFRITCGYDPGALFEGHFVFTGRVNVNQPTRTSDGPLEDLEHWDEFLQQRYPENESQANIATSKDKSEFRDYRKEARPSVKEFYRLNHTQQTYDFVQQKRDQYLPLSTNAG